MQRASDLVWMAQGVAKVGQACLQRQVNCVSSCIEKSSVLKPLKDKLPSCSTKEDDEFDMSEYDQTVSVDDVLNDSSKSVSVNNVRNNISKSGMSSTKPTLFSRSRFTGLTTKLDFSSKHRSLHTSSAMNAITADELAMLANVRQIRRNKDMKATGPSVKKMQERLTTRAKERKVPSSRLGRVMSFGNLTAGLALGTLTNAAKKAMGSDSSGSVMGYDSAVLSDANMTRIVDTLCRVRGAALKLGQMLSIQDDSVISPELLAMFERVRQSADYMPASQMHKVLVSEFGPNWRDLVKEFDDTPFAAASIGQVHRCVLHDGREVAMKIQYPGVAESIDSDINNLVTLLKVWNLFPPNFFIDEFITVARRELSWECDYVREAAFGRKFKEALSDQSLYGVPEVIDELSTKRVITTELISGIPVDQTVDLDQDTRNYIGAALLQLVLREVFEFRCMQTDPNWANFFYNESENKLYLLDFGASRTYSKEFVDLYIDLVKGAADNDKDKVMDISYKLGFLTGYEPQVLKDAHASSILTVGEPFADDGNFDFATQQTSHRVAEHLPTFLKHRLSPPPEEVYSLHRKLSGAFLMSMRLKSNYACKEMFEDTYRKYWSQDNSITIDNVTGSS